MAFGAPGRRFFEAGRAGLALATSIFQLLSRERATTKKTELIIVQGATHRNRRDALVKINRPQWRRRKPYWDRELFGFDVGPPTKWCLIITRLAVTQYQFCRDQARCISIGSHNFFLN
ncbi:MAG: hypothetical protein JO308_14130 [Verrucomicrobia bacterium]|nr:hypothetical protein [Verrucomicrobiota bacterium]